MSALVPPDLEQCQAEKPNGYSFMTLGGRPGRVRCTSRPTVVVEEAKPGGDGQIGSMSLCDECLEVAKRQLGADAFMVTPITPLKNPDRDPYEYGIPIGYNPPAEWDRK